jgi:hypothetical protein
MTAIGALPVLPGGSSGAAGSRALRVEKPRDCAGAHGEYRNCETPDERRTSTGDRRDLSQRETVRSAPLWYGPRLRAPFVAQVLGQVLGTTGNAVGPGYREDGVPTALIVDRFA